VLFGRTGGQNAGRNAEIFITQDSSSEAPLFDSHAKIKKSKGRFMEFSQPNRPNEPEEQILIPNLPMVYVSEPIAWEYKHISRNLKDAPPPSEEELNNYGKEGWELVSSLVYADKLHLYFKRPKN
jgi:hypothetical protein